MATFKTPTLDGSGRVREKHLPANLGAATMAGTFAPATGSTAYVGKVAPLQTTTSLLANVYNPESNWYNLKASNLRRFRKQLGLASTQASTLCRIAMIGDSQVGGTGANVTNESWARIMTNRASSLGLAMAVKDTTAFSFKETANDTRYSHAGGWGTFGGAPTVAIGFLTNSNLNPLTYTSVTAGTVVEIATIGTGTPFNVAIDGGAPELFTPSGAQAVERYTKSGLSNAVHTVVITPTQTVNCHILWVEVRATAGLAILNAGIGGSRAQAWASTLFYSARQAVTAYGPNLIGIGLGTNDKIASRTPAQFKADMQTIISGFVATTDVFLTTPLNSSGLDISAYRPVYYELADQYNIPLFDVGDRVGTYAEANALGLMVDAYHAGKAVNHDVGLAIAAPLFG